MRNFNYIDINIINRNFKLLYFNYLINQNKFILFFDYDKLFNFQKLDIISDYLKVLILNSFFIKNLFNYNFYFLNSFIISIFVKNIEHFNNVIKLIEKEKKFCFSFNYSLSSYTNRTMLFSDFYNRNLQFVHYVIFRVVYSIIIIILFFLVSIIKYMK